MSAALVGETYWRRLVIFYIPLFMFVVAMLFPFLWMLITSLKPDPELYNPRISPFIVRDPTLEHWQTLFGTTLFTRWAINTLWVAIASTALSLFAGVLAGYALARLVFPGSTLFGIMIFVTYLVPPTLLFIPLTGVVTWMGLQDTSWSLIFTYPTFLVPFCTWLLMGYFQTIPRELEECARIGRRHSPAGAFQDRGAAGRARDPLGRDLRLHAVVERVPLRAGVHPLARDEDHPGRRQQRADQG